MTSRVTIHPTALVDAGASLDPTVEVGPYAVLGPGVTIGAGTRIGAHCVIEGETTIGRDNVVHPFCAIGRDPQDKKYAGEPTALRIGDRNTFREYVTVNRGTAQDKGVTTVGDDNWVMAYVHVAHDCVIGSHVIMANATNLAGHVEIGDHVVLGGFTGVHQFCKVGAHAMTGVGTVVLHDIPPFVMAAGNTASAHGINSEGLRRRGFDAGRINRIRRAYRTLYKSGLTLEDARRAIGESAAADDSAGAQDLRLLCAFLERVTRGIVR